MNVTVKETVIRLQSVIHIPSHQKDKVQSMHMTYFIINICNIHTVEDIVFKIIPQHSSQDIK